MEILVDPSDELLHMSMISVAGKVLSPVFELGPVKPDRVATEPSAYAAGRRESPVQGIGSPGYRAEL